MGDPPVVTGCGGSAGLQGDAQDPLASMKAGLFPHCSPEVCTDGYREISPLVDTWNPLDTKPTPSPPQGTRTEEPSHHRLRGSHISFNSNIRVLNIQRARGQGGIYSASKYTASTDRDKLKTAREEKVLLAPPQLALWAGGAATMPKGDGASTGCLLVQDFPRKIKKYSVM